MRLIPLVLLAACTGTETDTDFDTSLDGDVDTDAYVEPVDPATDDMLTAFYALHGGRDALPAHHVDAVETLLRAQDEIESGDRAAARARIDTLFTDMPLSTSIWRDQVPFDDTNIGDPVAYYGLRMLDQVLELGDTPTTGSLKWVVVVAECADVTRPTLPNLESETVRLEIAPEILEDDARRLFMSTRLFRRWVHAITGGLEVELVVHTMTTCTTVDYTDDGSIITSYPDSADMVSSVPADIAEGTDLWWVVAPSGVPGDGSGYDRHFITGGMGGIGLGQPLFLSDDGWFTRKPEHLGNGEYTDVELRAYQPQWFQHEFMHHLFGTWPELGLEATGHQWFDRSTWPDDFVGVWEPDYYAEAIDKRLLDVSPSLAEGLTAPEFIDPELLVPDALVGDYEHNPVENDWHEVSVTSNGGVLTWENAAGRSWGLEIRDGGLWTQEDCPYGVLPVSAEADGSTVRALWVSGDRYGRVPTTR